MKFARPEPGRLKRPLRLGRAGAGDETEERLGPGITAYSACEAVFSTYLVVPAQDTARAGFPHDLVETERGEPVPVEPPD